MNQLTAEIFNNKPLKQEIPAEQNIDVQRLINAMVYRFGLDTVNASMDIAKGIFINK